ncbi:hypothetical protein AYI70_g7724 [Smittium culicis]|uniref:Tyr recombinase domain-containing protein n=1 Tax=Smittium culicis TaxID=133412 RepID=A0A1R1XJ81_9FUNG|nr:hypothetical protein AYI70_g7724 [Smittium culicis]
MFSEFTRTLNDASIKSYVRPEIDISPVLYLFKEWGPSNECSIKKLTAKICWLLSVTGFLRASDIHRIDDERSHVSLGVLNLVIIAPKEKRSGRQIEKPCQISPHTDPILCPVVAYLVYKEKVVTSLVQTHTLTIVSGLLTGCLDSLIIVQIHYQLTVCSGTSNLFPT